MRLDLRTAVTFLMWLTLVCAFLAMTMRLIRRTHPGYGRWAIAGLLLVLSLFLLSLRRAAPDWISIVSANSGIAIAAILYLEGARQFRSLVPHSRLAYAGGVFAIGAVAFYCYTVPSMNARGVVMSTFLGIVLTGVSITMLQGIPPVHKLGQTLTGGMFGLCAATLVAHAFYCYFGPPMSDGNALSGLHGVFFLAILTEMTSFSLGLTLLMDERVTSDLNEVRKRASRAGEEVARHIETAAALRESDERFRFAQRAAGIGTFDWDIETGVTTWTPELEVIYGLPPGGFPGTQKAWEDLVHPDDRAAAVQRVGESFDIGVPVEQEWRVIWPDGSVHWISGRWQVFKDGVGKPLHVVGVNIDITDRKTMEEALRKSEERLRLAIKATNDAIWDIDLKAGTVSWNDTYSVLYGRPETADTWQFWIDRIHPEDRARTVDDFQAALSGCASSWSSEYRFRRVDGQWAYIYDRAYIARDASRNAWRVIGAMQDLTQQKQSEAALRESEERFRRVFEEGPLGINLVGEDYRILKVNSAFCQMLGYSEAELLQKSFADITHPDDVPTDLVLAERLFRGEIPFYRMQKRYVKKNCEIIWINLTASLLRDLEGQPLYGLGMIEDITAVKRAQEESMARQKLESLGTLAGGIAHDFNNLLGAVEAQAELALAELDDGSSCKEQLRSIREVSMRGSEIVRQLMIYAGQESEVVGLVDLSAIVQEMLPLLKASLSKHANITSDLEPDLPLIRAGAAQLRQILMNLVTNASDAIGDRDGVIRVKTRRVRLGEESATRSEALPDGYYLVLDVSDEGRGMSLETQSRVFDPFFTTKSAGHGLGLAVVSGIVRGLGGAIRLTSELGKGTTFQILLPSSEVQGRVTSDVLPNLEALPGPQEIVVLIVEDENSLRDGVAKMLRKTGFEVLEAADGSTAIDLLRTRSRKVDVILLDMTIPGASSQEVVAEAVKAHPDTRLVLTSAYSQETIANRVCAPRVVSFIRKPFRIGDLVQTVRDALCS